jgi:hypothetical protein
MVTPRVAATGFEFAALSVSAVSEEAAETTEDERALFSASLALLSVHDGDYPHGAWNLRGVGEVKILQHATRGTIRLLMTQRTSDVVLANHIVDKRIMLVEDNEKTWRWAAFDYSTGELVETKFQVNFNSSYDAAGFGRQFKAAQDIFRVPSEA